MDLEIPWKRLIPRKQFFLCLLVSGCMFASGQLSFATTATSGVQTNPPAANGATFDQQLTRCLDIAKQGDVKQAFAMAKQTKQLHRHQRMFDVSYINVLMTIVDESESTCEVKILNEVITVVKEAKKNKIYDGNGDAEVAFHFMKSLGRLATLIDSVNASVANKIRVFEGTIAVNLKSNPGYPKYAVEALSAPMVDMAKAYAYFQDQAKCFDALTNAVRSGYGDYAVAAKEDWLTNVADTQTVTTLIGKLDSEYKIAVKNWSQTVLTQFRPIDFRFNVNSLQGQPLNNQSLQGKVVVVDLWATWCAPCRKGLPHFKKLHKDFGNEVVVMGISMDKPTNPNSAVATVREFVKKEQLEYPIAMGDQSIEGQLTQKMVLPTTIFFDRTGKVRYIARGYHDAAKLEAITKRLVEQRHSVNSGFGQSF